MDIFNPTKIQKIKRIKELLVGVVVVLFIFGIAIVGGGTYPY